MSQSRKLWDLENERHQVEEECEVVGKFMKGQQGDADIEGGYTHMNPKVALEWTDGL